MRNAQVRQGRRNILVPDLRRNNQHQAFLLALPITAGPKRIINASFLRNTMRTTGGRRNGDLHTVDSEIAWRCPFSFHMIEPRRRRRHSRKGRTIRKRISNRLY
jgi:hypothetical protein